MADRPILFSAPMVAAVIGGRKTQTRRLLPNPEYYGCPTGDCPHDRQDECNRAMIENTAPDLRFSIGDQLWVRETYYQRGHWWEDENDLTTKGKPKWKFVPADHNITFDAPLYFFKARSRAHPTGIFWYKRLGRFMARRYSRLTLLVTNVRVQRLQDCSEEDAIAEGVVWRPAPFEAWSGSDNPNWPMHTDPVRAYRGLWNTINGPGAWEANPWVVAVSFDVKHRNIDSS